MVGILAYIQFIEACLFEIKNFVLKLSSNLVFLVNITTVSLKLYYGEWKYMFFQTLFLDLPRCYMKTVFSKKRFSDIFFFVSKINFIPGFSIFHHRLCKINNNSMDNMRE